MDAEEAGEFFFEMKKGARCGLAGVEVGEGAEEQVEEFGDGVLGLGDQFDELDEIGGELGAEVIGAQAIEGAEEGGLAQGVEIAFAAGYVGDLCEEEEVELAGEGAAGAAGALCGGLEASVGLGEPGDDPTGIAEPDAAQKDGLGAVQRNESVDARGRMGKKSPMADETTQTGVEENSPTINIDELKTTYANICRIAQTPNEIIVDFGMNPNFFGPILTEPLKLESRIIMSYDGAKRLLLHLANVIQSYEAKYGTIELEVGKRVKKN